MFGLASREYHCQNQAGYALPVALISAHRKVLLVFINIPSTIFNYLRHFRLFSQKFLKILLFDFGKHFHEHFLNFVFSQNFSHIDQATHLSINFTFFRLQLANYFLVTTRESVDPEDTGAHQREGKKLTRLCDGLCWQSHQAVQQEVWTHLQR